MATIKAFVRSNSNNASIRLRLLDGRDRQYFGKTNIEINPQWWNSEKEELKARLVIPGISKDDINDEIKAAKKKVMDYYRNNRESPENFVDDWITKLLSRELDPLKVVEISMVKDDMGVMKVSEPVNEKNFFEYYDDFMEYKKDKKVSEGRMRHFRVVKGMLERFAMVKKLDLNIHTFDQVSSFEKFLRDEHKFYKSYPDIYGKTRIGPRGQNTLNSKLIIVQAFFTYLFDNDITNNLPFKHYEYFPEVYADPIPLLPEELDILLNFKGLKKAFDWKRKAFCLQCLVGCRAGDYMRLKESNINEDILFYLPKKTFKHSPKTVYVPLVEKAQELIGDLHNDTEFLIPRMTLTGKDGYNQSIKKIAKAAGLTRKVQTINPITLESEVKELWEVMTSHTARKTFVNCNYMETQDPALISKMTGHSPNSKAFARYRNLDIELLKKQMKKAFGE